MSNQNQSIPLPPAPPAKRADPISPYSCGGPTEQLQLRHLTHLEQTGQLDEAGLIALKRLRGELPPAEDDQRNGPNPFLPHL